MLDTREGESDAVAAASGVKVSMRHRLGAATGGGGGGDGGGGGGR